MIYQNIYQLIGNTPIIELQGLTDDKSATVYLKLEWFNPGGSVKDRIAINMIEAAEQEGLLKKGDTIVEPTSGNISIGGLEISGKSLAAHLVLFLTAYLSFGNAFVLAILSFDFSSMTFASQFSLELIVGFIVFDKRAKIFCEILLSTPKFAPETKQF